MAEPENPNYGSISCFFQGCENPPPYCFATCYNTLIPLPPPPPPPLPPPSSSHNHMAPFLIATVCILGISFLLLSTCTIILRFRFTSRRRGVSPASPNDSSINDDLGSVVDHPIWHITTIGLQQSVIDSITAFKYKKIDGFFVEGSDLSCSVCLTEFEEGDDLRLLPKCSHAFHISCIDTWLRSHKNCPLCRAPIVNEISRGDNSDVAGLNLSNSSAGEDVVRVNLDDNDGGLVSGGGGEGSSLGGLPVSEGVRIAEALKKNRELRVFSDLGENHRFRGVEEGLEPVRRSFSFNAVAASAIFEAVVSNEGSSSNRSPNEGSSSDRRSNERGSSDRSSNEGCSRDGNSRVVLQKENDLEKGGNKRGLSMSGLLMKSPFVDPSLQKGPVSMKRSLSSSSRFFSFRRTKSQASILPL